MVVDTEHRPSNVYAVVFYIRGQSKADVAMLKESLQRRYKVKFEHHSPVYTSFQYSRISECVYLMVDTNEYDVSVIARNFTKAPPSINRTITCRVGFYYGISEEGVIETANNGAIGIFPAHMARAL